MAKQRKKATLAARWNARHDRREREFIMGKSLERVFDYFVRSMEHEARRHDNYVALQKALSILPGRKVDPAEYSKRRGWYSARHLGHEHASHLVMSETFRSLEYAKLYHLTEKDKQHIMSVAADVEAHVGEQSQPKYWAQRKMMSLYDLYRIPLPSIGATEASVYFGYVDYFSILLEDVDVIRSTPEFKNLEKTIKQSKLTTFFLD